MWRRVLIICGTILLVGSIGFAFYTKTVVDNGTSKAQALDKLIIYHHHQHNPCFNALSWKVTVAKSAMSENETQPLTVSIANQSGTVACEEIL